MKTTNNHTRMSQTIMKRIAIDRLRRALLGTGLLGSLLLLASCGVTEPNTEGWQDVSEFSWPTEIGTTMTFRKEETINAVTEITDIHFDVARIDPASDDITVTPYGTLNLKLTDTNQPSIKMVHFLATDQLLVARQDLFGGDPALLLKSPLEEGHRWYCASDSLWEAEVVGLYSLRKIEGTLYENVVAIRYREADPRDTNFAPKQEYIRFYARGIGEVMTIRNSFGESSTGNTTNTTLELKRVLISTQPAS